MQLRHLVWLGVTAFAFLDSAYRYMDRVAAGSSIRPILPILVEQLTGTYGLLVLVPIAFRAVRLHTPLTYVYSYFAFTILHTFWNWGTRLVLFPIFGFGSYNYGRMPERFLMEAPVDLIGFVIICLLRRQYLAWQRARAIEAELIEARMDLLTRQIQPHFLFNSLNTISSLMHEDTAKADAVLQQLARFLRSTTDLQNQPVIPLEQEFALLSSYVAVMQARFEDQLDYRCEWDHDLASFRVPPLLLQPLVENAIEHGRASSGIAHVRVHAARDGQHLRIEIQDQGPGVRDSEPGYGLEAVRQRLRTVYGERARLILHPVLQLEIPLA